MKSIEGQTPKYHIMTCKSSLFNELLRVVDLNSPTYHVLHKHTVHVLHISVLRRCCIWINKCCVSKKNYSHVKAINYIFLLFCSALCLILFSLLVYLFPREMSVGFICVHNINCVLPLEYEEITEVVKGTVLYFVCQ